MKNKEKVKNKWSQYIGCSAIFDPRDAFLVILPYARVLMMGAIKTRNVNIVEWMVTAEEPRHIRVTADGVTVSRVPKKYVRIHGSKRK